MPVEAVSKKDSVFNSIIERPFRTVTLIILVASLAFASYYIASQWSKLSFNFKVIFIPTASSASLMILGWIFWPLIQAEKTEKVKSSAIPRRSIQSPPSLRIDADETSEPPIPTVSRKQEMVAKRELHLAQVAQMIIKAKAAKTELMTSLKDPKISAQQVQKIVGLIDDVQRTIEADCALHHEIEENLALLISGPDF